MEEDTFTKEVITCINQSMFICHDHHVDALDMRNNIYNEKCDIGNSRIVITYIL